VSPHESRAIYFLSTHTTKSSRTQKLFQYSLVNNGVDRGRGGRQPCEVAQTLAGLLPVHQVVVVVAGRVEAGHGVHGDVGLLAPVAVAPRGALGAHLAAPHSATATRIFRFD
jgi:hypothetical protein